MDTMTPFVSAVASITRQKAIQAADDAHKPHPTEAEIQKLIDEAEFKAVYGHDAVRRADGTPVVQGIGAPGRETPNHFAAIRKYEGQQAWERAVREIFRRDPDRAKKLGLPMPPRVGA
jgi:hypothetical protein